MSSRPVAIFTTNEVIDYGYAIYIADASSNNITFTLPDSSDDGSYFTFSRIDFSSNIVTIQTMTATQFINGSPTYNLEKNKQLTLSAVNGNWWNTTEGGLPTGTNYSDYLYWDTGTNSFHVDSAKVHIGANAGLINQANNSVALGSYAGYSNLGTSSISIGSYAGYTGQVNNSIAINASGTGLNPTTAGFYVNPIRSDTGPTGTNLYPLSLLSTHEIIENKGNLYVESLSVGNNVIDTVNVTSITGVGLVTAVATASADNIKGGIVQVYPGGLGVTLVEIAMPTPSSLVAVGNGNYKVDSVINCGFYPSSGSFALNFNTTQPTGVNFFTPVSLSLGVGVSRHIQSVFTNVNTGTEAYTVYA